MFERYQVKGVYFALDNAMSLYSAGRTTGLVLSSGERETYATPIFEGRPLSYAI